MCPSRGVQKYLEFVSFATQTGRKAGFVIPVFKEALFSIVSIFTHFTCCLARVFFFLR